MDEIINEAIRKFQKELNGGTAALVLLGVLDKAEKPMYGYQIAKIIEAQTGDVDIMKQGALYPVLRSLESTGLLESEVEPSVSGPPRRYYKITLSGRRTLAKWIEIWHQTSDFVGAILKGENDDK
jgi:PadR family transcriptional regulator, regulatory protein PadR